MKLNEINENDKAAEFQRALQSIANFGGEQDEWDAVERYRKVREIACMTLGYSKNQTDRILNNR